MATKTPCPPPALSDGADSFTPVWTVRGLVEVITAWMGPGAAFCGEGETVISTVCHPQYITQPNAMVVVLDEAVIPLLQQAVAQQGQPFAGILTPNTITLPEGLAKAQLTHSRVRVALGVLLKVFSSHPHVNQGIHPTAIIDPTATLGSHVTVGAYTVVGPQTVLGSDVTLMPHVTVGAGVSIGAHSWLFSGVRVADGSVLGERVILHHNVSIGSDGFSYVTPEKGRIEAAQSGDASAAQNTTIHKIESLGNVVIEDDVEVGANTTIDRANLGPTLIKRGTKIDNLVMIGHNNTIGQNCLIAGQTGVAGSCVVGDRVVMGGQVGTADHLTIGDDAILMARSALMRDVPAGDIQAGMPAQPHREYFKKWAAIDYIASLRKTVRDLEKRLQILEKANSSL
ncbi:MAG: UDP-3-O-(3-hydroxymyristoyl)glucosamine N-acyltransferase [Vampirovibrionales bacterium]